MKFVHRRKEMKVEILKKKERKFYIISDIVTALSVISMITMFYLAMSGYSASVFKELRYVVLTIQILNLLINEGFSVAFALIKESKSKDSE